MISSLIRGRYGFPTPIMTSRDLLLRGLQQGLVSYWSGDGGACGADLAFGGNVCGSGGGASPVAALGVDGEANGAIASPFLQRASASCTNLDFHTGDFTVAGWVKVNNSNLGILSRWVPGSNARKWSLLIESGVGKFACSTDGTATNSFLATAGSSLGNNAWHFLVGWRDTAASKIWLQVDNGTPASTTLTGGSSLFTGAANLAIGALDTSGTYSDSSGIQDSLGAWSRMLTDAERNALYNGGVGLKYTHIARGY